MAGIQTKSFTTIVSAAGALALVYSIYRLCLDPARLDWMLLLVLMLAVVSQVESYIPRAHSNFNPADTLIHIGVLMLDPWAATVLCFIDRLALSLNRTGRAAVMNIKIASMNLAVLTASVVTVKLFGPLDNLVSSNGRLGEFFLALALLALISYMVRAGIVTTEIALSRGPGAVKLWWENNARSSLALLVSLLAAGMISKTITMFGFYSLLISFPVLLIAYISYKFYLEKMEESKEQAEKLTRLHLATIESLTMAIDAKDQTARGHIHRVRLLVEGVARAADYPEDLIEGLKAAALLHDIGKLAVPSHILSKPGKLSTAEYSKIRLHPIVGADILSSVEFPYDVVPIVKHHHEKFDGTGYPNGLKGEEIPLGARILTIVDCYDALVNNRPYRPCYTREMALELMHKESSRSFDPVLLEKFFEVIATIEDTLPTAHISPVSLASGGQAITAGLLFDPIAGRGPQTRTEEALRDIAAAQREVLSLYEISQTLGSTLNLSEVLPIVAAKLEKVANFTTMVIYLAEGNRLRASQVTGKNAEALRNLELFFGEGGAGWVAVHRQVLIGGSPLADLERAIGQEAARYRSTAIFPLLREDELMGALALYSEEDRGYSADEVRMLETISSHAATAVSHALTFERTQESALTDNLTGLPNSRYLYSFFDQERSRAERHNYPLVMMMMDLDGFKKVNDTYGHHVGDDILRRIASSLRTHLRTDDTLIRYAGDEFVAVLHRATPEIVLDLKSRLQSAIDNASFEVRPGRLARVGISIGHATYGQDGTTIGELMEMADGRMYQNKLARRNNVPSLRLASSRP